MSTNKENAANLLALIKENPELEIVPLVCCDVVDDDSYCSWRASWGKVKIEEYYEDSDRERIYFKSDTDDLFDEFYDKFEEEGYADCQLEEMANAEIDKLPWKKAIIVYIEPN